MNYLATSILSNNLLYIDPATTTVLLSSLTSIIVSLGAVFLIWGRTIKKQLSKVFKLDENKNKEVEADIIVTDKSFIYDESSIPEIEVALTEDSEENQAQKPQDDKGYFNKERKKRILPSLLVAFGIMLLTCVVAPLEIFANNIDEFLFEVGDFLPLCMLYGTAIMLVIFALLFFTPKCVYKVLYAFFVGVLLMLLIQTNFLNFGLNSVAGDNNSSTVTTFQVILSTAIWCVVIAGFITAIFLIKNFNLTRIISLVLVFAITMSQVVSGVVIASGDLSGEVSNNEQGVAIRDTVSFLTNKNLTTISTTKNVYVFIVDRFDGKLFAEPALKDYTAEEYEKTFGELEGFTYFDDYVALYGRTYPAVTSMISNMEWTKDENGAFDIRKDYFNKAYQTNDTIIRLAKEGYDVNLYVDDYYCYSDAYNFYYEEDGEKIHYVDNVIQVPKEDVTKIITNKFILSARMLQMSFYRSLPFFLKSVGNGVSSNTCNSMVIYDFGGDNDYSKWTSDMKNIFTEVSTANFETTDKPKFTYMLLSGTHGVDYDENWETFKGNADENIQISVKNSFKIINEFIKELKTAGVYDESTIIITGDHSYMHDDYREIDLTNQKEARITALFVKPAKSYAEANGIAYDSELTWSTAQVAQSNLWTTIFKSEGITLTDEQQETFGNGFYDIAEGEVVTRKLIWQKVNLLHTEFDDIVYEIKGRASQMGENANGEQVLINWTKKSSNYFGQAYYD